MEKAAFVEETAQCCFDRLASCTIFSSIVLYTMFIPFLFAAEGKSLSGPMPPTAGTAGKNIDGHIG